MPMWRVPAATWFYFSPTMPTASKAPSSLTVESCSGDLVKTSLSGSSHMTWRLGGGKIKDVQVSGIWLALQLRQNFGNVMKRVRGDIGETHRLSAGKSGGETRPKKD